MSFVYMDVEDVITAFVEAMLPRFTDENTILAVSLELKAQKETGHEPNPVRRKVHLMFHRPNNYTKVLWNISQKRGYDKFENYTDWVLRAYHDSGWVTDGINTPFFNLKQEMRKELELRNPTENQRTEVLADFYVKPPRLLRLKSWSLDEKKRVFRVEYEK